MIWLILLVLLMCAAVLGCAFEGAIRAPTNPLLDPERAKNFTEEEAVQLQATAQAPVVVAGSARDLSDARVNRIFAVQVMPYAEDAKTYAAGLLGLYVVPEVER